MSGCQRLMTNTLSRLSTMCRILKSESTTHIQPVNRPTLGLSPQNTPSQPRREENFNHYQVQVANFYRILYSLLTLTAIKPQKNQANLRKMWAIQHMSNSIGSQGCPTNECINQAGPAGSAVPRLVQGTQDLSEPH